MRTKNKILRLLMFSTLILATLLIGFNEAQAARVYVGVGTSYGYGYGYGPYGYGPSMVYVPGHWYRGYWIPGQYAEYAGYPPGQGYVWYQGGYGYNGYWQRGHWGRGYGGYHHHR